METFSGQKNPVDLYLWNAQLAKAFLEDIEHFEVLLRNWIDRCVVKAWGGEVVWQYKLFVESRWAEL